MRHRGRAEAKTRCANCHAELQGDYCHRCGQSAHDPVRQFGHFIEEVFESFWHLDSRIVKTLRDLFVPGRVARNYLMGHRAPYIAPLKLFIALSLLAFLFGEVGLSSFKKSYSEGYYQDCVRARERVRMESLSTSDFKCGFFHAKDLSETIWIRARYREKLKEYPLLVSMREDRLLTDREYKNLRRDMFQASLAHMHLLGASFGRMREEIEANRVDYLDKSDAYLSDDDSYLYVRSIARWNSEQRNFWERKLREIELNSLIFELVPTARLDFIMVVGPKMLVVMAPLLALIMKLIGVFTVGRRFYLGHLVASLYNHCFILMFFLIIFSLLLMLPESSMGMLLWATTLVCLTCYLLLAQKNISGEAWTISVLKFVVGAWSYCLLFYYLGIYVVGALMNF